MVTKSALKVSGCPMLHQRNWRDICTDYGSLISHLLNVCGIQIGRKEIYTISGAHAWYGSRIYHPVSCW